VLRLCGLVKVESLAGQKRAVQRPFILEIACSFATDFFVLTGILDLVGRVKLGIYNQGLADWYRWKVSHHDRTKVFQQLRCDTCNKFDEGEKCDGVGTVILWICNRVALSWGCVRLLQL